MGKELVLSRKTRRSLLSRAGLKVKPATRKMRVVRIFVCMSGIGISGWTYFDNDAKVKAPFDAQRLRERLEKGVAAK